MSLARQQQKLMIIQIPTTARAGRESTATNGQRKIAESGSG